MSESRLVIELQNPAQYATLPLLEDMTLWLNAALEQEQASCVIRVVDVEEGRQLNLDYRGKDYPTNVLSFPNELPDIELSPELMAELDEGYLGDLVLCADVVEREAQAQNKSLAQHWAHLLIHGLLHLQGYDHLNDADAELMEAREIEILAAFNFPNPYAEH